MSRASKRRGSYRPAASAIVLTLACAASPQRVSAAAPIPAGVWQWDDGRAAVVFHACGDALCGRVVWLKQDTPQNAPPLLDVKNPDPALRQRPICGLDYITGVKQTAGGKWKNGRVYDFNGGATYDLDIDAVDAGRVTMRGYKGVRLFGATLTLVRPKSPLPACGTVG